MLAPRAGVAPPAAVSSARKLVCTATSFSTCAEHATMPVHVAACIAGLQHACDFIEWEDNVVNTGWHMHVNVYMSCVALSCM